MADVAGPMLDRLHAQKSRWSWVVEDDCEAWVLPTLVLRIQWQRYIVLLAFGPWRAGVAWRRA